MKQESCSYYDPTDLGNNTNYKNIRVGTQTHPTSPHVHGMSVRPIYDGNPLSWFNNAGDKGIGYISAQNT